MLAKLGPSGIAPVVLKLHLDTTLLGCILEQQAHMAHSINSAEYPHVHRLNTKHELKSKKKQIVASNCC